MKAARQQIQGAFTLIELLVVIAILGVIAALAVPALNLIKKGDAIAAATQQVLDDLAYARQLAISRHTTNYMVFVPPEFWTRPGYIANNESTQLFDKQFIGYTFVTLRSVGDQPGTKSPDYIGSWRVMPEGTYITTNKFVLRDPLNTFNVVDPVSGITKYKIKGFERTTAIPFPSEQVFDPANKDRAFAALPYIAFDSQGRLTSTEDEYIPIARGTLGIVRDAQTKVPIQAVPLAVDAPPGSAINYNVIHIDRLTGRARLEKRELQ